MKKSLFLTFLFFSAITCFSQTVTPDVIGSVGDFYSNASGMIQWTIGETMTETYGNTNNFITQGFQQPDDFTTHIIVQQNLNISLFPNPAIDHFTLEFAETGNYTIEIFDALGQKINSVQFFSYGGNAQEQISLAELSNGMYYVTIKKAGSESVSHFKLNKIS